MKWILLLLFLTVSVVRADGPDQEYIQIYNVIEQADMLAEKNPEAAAQRYREAWTSLKRLQSIYPTWNENVVKFRLDYLAEKVQSLASPVTAPDGAATDSKPAQPHSNPLVEQIHQLQAEKSALEAKLKDALSGQPGLDSPADVLRIHEEMLALQKERDLLKVALDQAQSASKAGNVSSPRGNDRDKELEQLRARLQALEARPTPFTAEELALFKQGSPKLAPVESKPVKKSRELPAGAGTLVAQAERAFAAQRFDEAEKKYLEVLRQDQNNVYILGNLAATQLEMNRVADAEKNIKTALENDPDDAFSLTLLGMIKFRQGNIDEALNSLSRAAKLDPENPETQNYLGITLSQKGQRGAAEAALRKAIQLQPNYPGAHHNLAVVYATQTPPFLELARWHYERSLALGHSKNGDLEKLLVADN